jgi:hypothetical protein
MLKEEETSEGRSEKINREIILCTLCAKWGWRSSVGTCFRRVGTSDN